MFPFRRCFAIIAAVLTSGAWFAPAMAEAPSGAEPRPAEATAAPGATEARSRNAAEAATAPAADAASKATPSESGPATAETGHPDGASGEATGSAAGDSESISEGTDDKDGKKPSDHSSKPKARRMAPSKVEELEALVIEGRIQKPEVFYVIGRAEADYRDQKLKKSFVKEILKSVEDNPF